MTLSPVATIGTRGPTRDKLRKGMSRTRTSFAFPQSVTLHTATNRLEAAQQRWIQEHTGQLRALVWLSGRSGLEIVASDERVAFSNERIARASLSSDTLVRKK